MPDEMELNRGNRKQLAELILEYTTDTIKKEVKTNEGGAGQKRNYTCINCKKPFGTTIGETTI